MFRFIVKTLFAVLVLAVLALAALRIAAALREQAEQSTAPTEGAFVETASVTFYTQSAGSPGDTPVLLAHGTAAWSGFWRRELDQLGAAGFHAIAFDMPPFGYSDRAADRDYSRTRQAERILDLVATLPAPPVMVAHSFGAAAVTEAVLRKPEAFAALVIIDGALGMQDAAEPKALPLPIRPRVLREAAVSASATNPLATGFLLRGLLHNKAAATDMYIDVLQQPQNRSGTTAAYADWIPSLLAPAPDSLSRDPANYADLALPVRIIWGDQDTVTPPSQAQALAAALGQGDVIYLEDVGHIPHIEAPEAFMAALLSVLKSLPQQ